MYVHLYEAVCTFNVYWVYSIYEICDDCGIFFTILAHNHAIFELIV